MRGMSVRSTPMHYFASYSWIIIPIVMAVATCLPMVYGFGLTSQGRCSHCSLSFNLNRRRPQQLSKILPSTLRRLDDIKGRDLVRVFMDVEDGNDRISGRENTLISSRYRDEYKNGSPNPYHFATTTATVEIAPYFTTVIDTPPPFHNTTNGDITTQPHNNTNGDIPSAIGSEEKPQPTEAGGYSHTTASKAKISAANKGKEPWNKGRRRTPEERAKISEGVRARNRVRFLEKIKGMNMTEDEWNAEQARLKWEKEEEKKRRRTEKGGYRPSKETREKISRVLKEKFQNGGIKRNHNKHRVGHKHTEETKEKIRNSLRKKWAEDDEYRKKMREKTQNSNASPSVRARISQSLKQRWKDPAFRSYMLAQMESKRDHHGYATDPDSVRHKISEAIKKKWRDADYRKKTLEGMAKAVRRPNATRKKKKKKVVKALKATTTAPQPKKMKKKSSVKTTIKTIKNDSQTPKRTKTKKSTTPKKKKSTKKSIEKASATTAPETTVPPSNLTPGISTPDDEERISRMREERRDLYDLLYGEDLQDDDADGDNPASPEDYDTMPMIRWEEDDDDDDLENFDPYGLDRPNRV